MYCSASSRRENSYFEEEVVPTFEKGDWADIHFCKWLVSISLHSISRANVSGTNTGSKRFYHVRLPDFVYSSCQTSEQPYDFNW